MSIERVVESIPPHAAHVVGLGSGATGLALWADWAQNLTVIVGLFTAFVALLGALFYGGYGALKFYAKWKRVRKGDFTE